MKNYDNNKKSTFIKYLDANTLYGWAKSKKLPTNDFRWMNETEINNLKTHPCILEVDLIYPVSLHKLHNEHSLTPQRLMGDKVEKLLPNLQDEK